MAVEAKRGCGYRKVGGLYMVGGTGGVPCDRLPIELSVCPCCAAGIKPTRGWTWVDTAALVGGDHTIAQGGNVVPCPCNPFCPLCHDVKSMGKSGLLWIGQQFYPTIEAFEAEAKQLGISRRIQALPRGFELGKSWILFAHAKGIVKPAGDLSTKYAAAIFRVWRPERIERIYTESQRGGEAALADEKRGIIPVYVPDSDKDHQGTAFDKEEIAEQEPPMFKAE